ncbi:MAG: hypothetical protein AAGJ86_02140 [Pseudomonadota bacterium]
MTVSSPILIIDADDQSATRLKGMIEFLDAPTVRVATPETWEDSAQGSLHAVFLGNNLSSHQVEALCADVEARCAGVPVVVVEQEVP